MRTSFVAAAAALAGSVIAQRPTNTSICDYYTTALLKNNTAANQYLVLTLVVNTAVIGNYTKPTIPGITFPDIAVTGILNNGTYNGTEVNLLPYFNGGLASSNRGGTSGVAVNFLDDGGAAPLLMNKPSNNMGTAQYRLLTHLYQFFGSLLGCSQQGMTGFAAYGGDASMYDVHKFMDLDVNEMSYFIEQVGLSAASFGVSQDDVTAVGMALSGLFNVRCAAPATVIPAQGAQLQSICIADDCPLAPNNTCNAYEPAVEPGVANATLAMGEGNATSPATSSYMPSGTAAMSGSSMMGSATGSAAMSATSMPVQTGAAAVVQIGSAAAAGGLALAAMLL